MTKRRLNKLFITTCLIFNFVVTQHQDSTFDNWAFIMFEVPFMNMSEETLKLLCAVQRNNYVWSLLFFALE